MISHRAECKTNGDSETLKRAKPESTTYNPCISSCSAVSDPFGGLKGISKTVSYEKMPQTDCGERDPLLKEIYRETSFIRSTGLTSSQTSLIGFGASPFPDLLDLPRVHQKMGSVERLPFCTMSRR